MNARVLDVSDYDRAEFFVIFENNEDLNVPLRTASLLHVTSLRASFRMYDLDHSGGTLPVYPSPALSVDDVTTSSTGNRKVGCQVVNKCAMVLLLDRFHRLKAI